MPGATPGVVPAVRNITGTITPRPAAHGGEARERSGCRPDRQCRGEPDGGEQAAAARERRRPDGFVETVADEAARAMASENAV